MSGVGQKVVGGNAASSAQINPLAGYGAPGAQTPWTDVNVVVYWAPLGYDVVTWVWYGAFTFVSSAIFLFYCLHCCLIGCRRAAFQNDAGEYVALGKEAKTLIEAVTLPVYTGPIKQAAGQTPRARWTIWANRFVVVAFQLLLRFFAAMVELAIQTLNFGPWIITCWALGNVLLWYLGDPSFAFKTVDYPIEFVRSSWNVVGFGWNISVDLSNALFVPYWNVIMKFTVNLLRIIYFEVITVVFNATGDFGNNPLFQPGGLFNDVGQMTSVAQFAGRRRMQGTSAVDAVGGIPASARQFGEWAAAEAILAESEAWTFMSEVVNGIASVMDFFFDVMLLILQFLLRAIAPVISVFGSVLFDFVSVVVCTAQDPICSLRQTANVLWLAFVDFVNAVVEPLVNAIAGLVGQHWSGLDPDSVQVACLPGDFAKSVSCSCSGSYGNGAGGYYSNLPTCSDVTYSCTQNADGSYTESATQGGLSSTVGSGATKGKACQHNRRMLTAVGHLTNVEATGRLQCYFACMNATLFEACPIVDGKTGHQNTLDGGHMLRWVGGCPSERAPPVPHRLARDLLSYELGVPPDRVPRVVTEWPRDANDEEARARARARETREEAREKRRTTTTTTTTLARDYTRRAVKQMWGDAEGTIVVPMGDGSALCTSGKLDGTVSGAAADVICVVGGAVHTAARETQLRMHHFGRRLTERSPEDAASSSDKNAGDALLTWMHSFRVRVASAKAMHHSGKMSRFDAWVHLTRPTKHAALVRRKLAAAAAAAASGARTNANAAPRLYGALDGSFRIAGRQMVARLKIAVDNARAHIEVEGGIRRRRALSATSSGATSSMGQFEEKPSATSVVCSDPNAPHRCPDHQTCVQDPSHCPLPTVMTPSVFVEWSALQAGLWMQDWNLAKIFAVAQHCWEMYDVQPDTNPLSVACDLRLPSCDPSKHIHCFPMTNGLSDAWKFRAATYDFKAQVKAWCNGTTAQQCDCPHYDTNVYQVGVFLFKYVPYADWAITTNAVKGFWSLFTLGTYATIPGYWFAQFWQGVFGAFQAVFTSYVVPNWVVYLWSDQGQPDVQAQRIMCAVWWGTPCILILTGWILLFVAMWLGMFDLLWEGLSAVFVTLAFAVEQIGKGVARCVATDMRDVDDAERPVDARTAATAAAKRKSWERYYLYNEHNVVARTVEKWLHFGRRATKPSRPRFIETLGLAPNF